MLKVISAGGKSSVSALTVTLLFSIIKSAVKVAVVPRPFNVAPLPFLAQVTFVFLFKGLPPLRVNVSVTISPIPISFRALSFFYLIF